VTHTSLLYGNAYGYKNILVQTTGYRGAPQTAVPLCFRHVPNSNSPHADQESEWPGANVIKRFCRNLWNIKLECLSLASHSAQSNVAGAYPREAPFRCSILRSWSSPQILEKTGKAWRGQTL